jgi:hypothetical protein
MCFDAAPSCPKRMLDVEHFVEEHVFHSIPGDRGLVEPAVHHDLIERGIEAAELRTPSPIAPAELRPMQTPAKIPPVEPKSIRTVRW